MAKFDIHTYGRQEVDDPLTGGRVKAVKVGHGARLLAALFGWRVVAPAGGRRSYSLIVIPPERSRDAITCEVPDPDWNQARSLFKAGQTEYLEGDWRVTYTPGHVVTLGLIALGRANESWEEVDWSPGRISCTYMDLAYHQAPRDLKPPEPDERTKQIAILREIDALEAAGQVVKTARPVITPPPAEPTSGSPILPNASELLQPDGLVVRQLALLPSLQEVMA